MSLSSLASDAPTQPSWSTTLAPRGPFPRPANEARPPTTPAFLLQEFERLTGRALSWPALASLPPSFLVRSSLSPAELLAAGQGRLSRRTVNVLRRALTAQDQAGPWSYGRLVRLERFGFVTLLEVLGLDASLPAQGQRRVAPHLQLEEEITRLLARSHDRTVRSPTPLIDQLVALVARELPATEAEIARRLQAARLTREPIDLGRVERALRFRDPPCPFAFFRRPGLALVVERDRLELTRLVHERALRALSITGIATVEQCAGLAGTHDLAFVRAVLSAKADLVWLGRGQQRFRRSSI